MSEIKSLSAPTISDKGISKLVALCAPKQFNENCTLFHMGYEQAKTEMRDLLRRYITIPDPDGDLVKEHVVDYQERYARQNMEAMTAAVNRTQRRGR